ncbi:hypothetical protein GCM10010102_26330 [Promicromonospora citrea]|uniref:Ankyrin repeat protein n=1 Tax=Promicromonospora citrea TaxID=43677 RepID=A0A8H9L521_9MICO|nr:hypothetical protein GCM10010102_26330 [Promicromonospora citrea]
MVDSAQWHFVLGVLAFLVGPVLLAFVGFGLYFLFEEIAFRRKLAVDDRRIETREQQKALVDAASDRERLEELVRNGADLDQRADRGDSPLHRAYLDGNTAAVRNLKEAGSRDVLNTDGLLPHEMTMVASAMALIEEGVALITDDGEYPDPQDGRRITSALRAVGRARYRVALDRAMPYTVDRLGRKYALVAIRVGQPGTEAILCRLLKRRGPGVERVATDFLNSGNGTLRTAAERWALANDYRIVYHNHGGSVTWGSP